MQPAQVQEGALGGPGIAEVGLRVGQGPQQVDVGGVQAQPGRGRLGCQVGPAEPELCPRAQPVGPGVLSSPVADPLEGVQRPVRLAGLQPAVGDQQRPLDLVVHEVAGYGR